MAAIFKLGEIDNHRAVNLISNVRHVCAYRKTQMKNANVN